MSRLKGCTILALAVGMLLVVGMFGLAAEPKYGGTLKVALWQAIDSLDPQGSVHLPFWHSALFSVWEPLIRYVAGEEVYQPLLAKSWEFKDDQTLVMHLQQGVEFHDGTTFNAQDVKFTVERMQDPDTAAPNARFVEMIGEVAVLDDYTVEFRLTKPYGGILTNLDFLVMLSSENPPSPDSDPVGTGPFQFVEWIPGDHLVLEAFDDYWQEGLPYLDELHFIIMPDVQTRLANLEADTIQYITDIAPEQVDRIEMNATLKLIEGLPNMLNLTHFVTDVPPMDNILIRRAVAHCMDRQGYLEAVLNGVGTVSENIYSPANPYYNSLTEEMYPYDLERAKALFDAAGYPENFPEDAYPLRVTVPAGNVPLEKAAVLLQSSLRSIGIECEIEKYDLPTWLRLRETRPMIITYYSYGGVDPSVQLSTNLISPGGNLPHYYDEKFAQLIQEGYAATDFEVRKQVYYRIQEKIACDVPFAIWSFYPKVGAMRSYVEGIWMQPSWSCPVYHEAWLNK